MRFLRFFLFCLVLSPILVPVSASADEMMVMAGPNPPYVMTKGLGVTGASVDAFEAIMKMNGIPFNRKAVKLVQWKRAYATTLAVPSCVMLNVPRTPDLEEKFQWVGPLDFPRLVLVGKADRDFDVKSVADASKYSIGALRDNQPSKELLALGVNPASLKLSSTFVQPLRALQGRPGRPGRLFRREPDLPDAQAGHGKERVQGGVRVQEAAALFRPEQGDAPDFRPAAQRGPGYLQESHGGRPFRVRQVHGPVPPLRPGEITAFFLRFSPKKKTRSTGTRL